MPKSPIQIPQINSKKRSSSSVFVIGFLRAPPLAGRHFLSFTSSEEERGMDEDLDFVGPAVLPGEPTEAVPGSEKKIRVMMERANRREQLFHPSDGIRRKNRF